MSTEHILNNISPSQIALNARIFKLVLGRVFKRVYETLDDEGKEAIQSIFNANDETAKELFIKERVPDFETIFKEEADHIEKEILSEVEKTDR